MSIHLAAAAFARGPQLSRCRRQYSRLSCTCQWHGRVRRHSSLVQYRVIKHRATYREQLMMNVSWRILACSSDDSDISKTGWYLRQRVTFHDMKNGCRRPDARWSMIRELPCRERINSRSVRSMCVSSIIKSSSLLRAWRPAIGGRCSSVGSRLSTKQTHVYIGDADSATPASKYSPPWRERRGTPWCVYASQEQNALHRLDSSSGQSRAWFFIRFIVVVILLLLLLFQSVPTRHVSPCVPPLLQTFFFRYFYSRLFALRSRHAVASWPLFSVVVAVIVATCQSKANHTRPTD